MIPCKNIVLFLGLFSLAQGCINMTELFANSFPGNLNRFTTKIYRNLLSKNTKENVIFSPLSLQTALMMSYAGAEGETEFELQKSLSLPSENKYEIIKEFGDLLKYITHPNSETKNDKHELNILNRLYVADRLNISQNFQKIVKDNFEAQAEIVNFIDKQKTAEKINHWIEQHTQEQIKSIVKENDLNALTNIILVDALTFKGKWKYAFNKQYTRSVEFKLNAQEKTLVDMMFINGEFLYADVPQLKAKILELPFSNSDRSMLILLPNRIENIQDLEEKLKNYDFKHISAQMSPQKVCVHLPKFRVEQEIDFKNALEEIGLLSMFSKKANFNSMFETPRASYISAIKQKIVFEIDEDGAETTNNIGFNGHCLSAHSPNLFYVDRPFMFAIRQDKALYLAGHINRI